MEPSDEDIKEVRQRVLDKLESKNLGLHDVHPRDVERLKGDRNWVRRFLLHHELDKEKAINMIVSTLKWRNKIGANDISHTNINLQIACSGGMFPNSRDKDGKLLFIIKVKANVKGAYKAEEVHKLLVYWFDRLERQEKGDRISIFFEMTGAGLSNLDMEFVQYLIMLFRDYYPYFLNYIIVFEMSWILNAAWKVVKSWMPAKSVDMVKFLGRTDLKDYVPVGEQLIEWGGNISYQFAFEPEFLPASGPTALQSGNSDDAKKKVHFAEDASQETVLTELLDTGKKLSPGQLLQLVPTDEIVFKREDGETMGLLNISNVTSSTVAYKIKTTSPDKYRVRPSAGLVSKGASLNISVHIQSGYSTSQLVRDKFLVMACPIDNDAINNQQLAEVWKKTSEVSLQQNRLRCSVAPSDAKDEEFLGYGSTSSSSVRLLQSMAPQLQKTSEDQEFLKKQVKQIKILLIVLVLWIVFLPLFLSSKNSLQNENTCQVRTSPSFNV